VYGVVVFVDDYFGVFCVVDFVFVEVKEVFVICGVGVVDVVLVGVYVLVFGVYCVIMIEVKLFLG